MPNILAGLDPTTVAVLLEDGGAVAGLGIAALCTALTHWTGNAIFDALGSVAVGGLLGLIAGGARLLHACGKPANSPG